MSIITYFETRIYINEIFSNLISWFKNVKFNINKINSFSFLNSFLTLSNATNNSYFFSSLTSTSPSSIIFNISMALYVSSNYFFYLFHSDKNNMYILIHFYYFFQYLYFDFQLLFFQLLFFQLLFFQFDLM